MPEPQASDAPRPGTAQAPRWLDIIVFGGAFLLTGIGGTGLILAMLGHYHWWIALPLGLVVAVALVWWISPELGRPRRAGRVDSWCALAALAIVAVACAWAWYSPSEHLLLDRDPGSYISTAKWLRSEGTLEVQNADSGLPGASGVIYGGGAVFDVGGHTLQFQFNHGAAVAAATAAGVLGDWGLLRIGGLVGAWALLAVYSVCVRASGRAWAGLLAVAALAGSLPFLYVVRDVYSEPFVMLLLWTGALVGVMGFQGSGWRLCAVAGLLIGATTWFRIDGLLYVALLVALAGIAPLFGTAEVRRARRRQMIAVWVSAGAAAVVGVVDLQAFSGRYAHDLASQFRQLAGLCVLAVLGSLVLLRLRKPLQRAIDRLRGVLPVLAAVAGIAIVAVMLWAWLIRPHLGEAHAADGTRTYAELAFVWMVWYLGPVLVAFAIAGAGVLVHRFVGGIARPPSIAVLAILLAGGLYWLQPNITPDQLWATRRYLPAALPALSVAAAIALVLLVVWLKRSLSAVAAGTVGAIAVIVSLSFVVFAAAPVPLPTQQTGMRRLILSGCGVLGPRPSVVVIGVWSEALILPQVIRSWCGVPTASAANGTLSPAQLAEARAAAARAGRNLKLVSFDPNQITALGVPLVGSFKIPPTARDVEHTLVDRPDRYYRADEEILPTSIAVGNPSA